MEYTRVESISYCFFYFVALLAASIYMLKTRGEFEEKALKRVNDKKLSFGRKVNSLLRLLFVVVPIGLYFCIGFSESERPGSYTWLAFPFVMVPLWYSYLLCFFTAPSVARFFVIRKPVKNICIVVALFCLETIGVVLALGEKYNEVSELFFPPASLFFAVYFYIFKDASVAKVVCVLLLNIIPLCLYFLLFKEILGYEIRAEDQLKMQINGYFDKHFDKWDGSSKKSLVFLHLMSPIIVIITLIRANNKHWFISVFFAGGISYLLCSTLLRYFFKIPKFLRSYIPKKVRQKTHIAIALYGLTVIVAASIFFKYILANDKTLINIFLLVGITVIYPCYLEFKRMLMLDNTGIAENTK